jgi:predicted ATP-grasp superfamily ATP-dependent carboligase
MNPASAGRRAPVAVFDNYWATTLAFARSLGKRTIPLHFYGKGAGKWSRYRTLRLTCPPIGNAAEFQPWLQEKVRCGEISRIAPTTDLIAYYVSAMRAEFAPEVQRSIAPLEEIEDCLIKTRFAAASARLGQPSPATAAPDSLDGAVAAAHLIGYPIMLKPKSHLVVGFEERGRVLYDEADLKRHFRRYDVAPGQEAIDARYPELRWPLLQRYLPSARSRVYSVSGFKDADGGVVVSALSFKREQWPPDVGVSTVQISYDDSRILATGLGVVEKLLSRGIFEVELLAEGESLYAIDLNPRAFGFVELDIARGADLPWLWYQSTFEQIHPTEQALRPIGLEARDRLRHFLNGLTHMGLGGRVSPAERRSSDRVRSAVSMVGHWSDPLPMIASNLNLLRHPRSLLRSQLALRRVARHSEQTSNT